VNPVFTGAGLRTKVPAQPRACSGLVRSTVWSVKALGFSGQILPACALTEAK